MQYDRRKCRLDIGGNPLPSDPANVGAHQLDRCHERERQWHRPQHIEAELRAGLGIGCDAAWVVVSDACDQARPNPREWMSLYTAPKDFESAHRVLARATSLLRNK